jgi:hypothetical protein
MVEGLVSLLIFLIVVVVIAAVLVWLIDRFLPALSVPARYIIGAAVLILVLVALLRLIQAGALGGLP